MQKKLVQGIQSVEIAGAILFALAEHGSSLNLGEIAKRSKMGASKVRRYLISLERIGLVRQDAATGQYDIGARAIDLGMGLLVRRDVIQLAGPEIERLRDEYNETFLLAVWGSSGPIAVRCDASNRPMTVIIKPGTQLPIIHTATGLAMAAYMADDLTSTRIARELREGDPKSASSIRTIDDVRAELMRVRERGYAFSEGAKTPSFDGSSSPGIDALSVPLVGQGGRADGAITVIGAPFTVNDKRGNKLLPAMKQVASQLSRQLGGIIE